MALPPRRNGERGRVDAMHQSDSEFWKGHWRSTALWTAIGLIMLASPGVRADSVTTAPTSANSQATSDTSDDAALRKSQDAIGRPVGDYLFHDTALRPVRLTDFRGRPLVVNLVYTACTRACPLTIETLGRAVDVARDALGPNSFSVVTIGFDAPADTPQRMKAFAMEHGVAAPNWIFLSGDHAAIDGLAGDVGFTFVPSAAGFDHLSQTTVVDEDGRVYRQIYGADFESPALVEPLKDLVLGRKSDLVSFAGLVNRIRLFCTLYNPASHRYRFDYSIFTGIFIGFVSLTAVGVLLIRGWIHSRPLR